MACFKVDLYTFDRSLRGLNSCSFAGDGYSAILQWYKSYANPHTTFQVYYNIYYSSDDKSVFSEGVKFVVEDSDPQSIILQDNFKLGDVYYFAIRASAFENNTLPFSSLPTAENNNALRIYPESILTQDLTDSSLIIPLLDSSLFPSSGILQIGGELIGYSQNINNNLILTSIAQRGLYGTNVRSHTTAGFDGVIIRDPFVRIFRGFEDGNNVIGCAENKFVFQYARTNADGYKEKVDIVTSDKDLQVVAAANANFPAYDYAGYHRTSPADLLAGKCIGSYFGGEYGCADSDTSIGTERGISAQDANTQREEMLLDTTGEPVKLFKRMYKGKTSQNYDSSRENTAYRGLDNYGTELVTGYEEYFNTRRSDGRIMIRFDPTKENYERREDGIENVFVPGCWTIVIPPIKDGDFFIRFNQDGSEEFRYEVVDVTRNRTFLQETGRQTFTAVRIRKTDPIQQVRSFRDTAMFPSEILTTISSVPGPGGISAHMHRIIRNESDISNWSQTSSISQGHNHTVVFQGGKLIALPVLGHFHEVII